MDAIKVVTERMARLGDAPAVFWRGEETSYTAFFERIDRWKDALAERSIGAGSVCGVMGDYSPGTTSLFFALMDLRAIIVPFARQIVHHVDKFREIAGVQCMFTFSEDDSWTFESFDSAPQNDLINTFREQSSPGLVVFTSGSTGEPKGILQDCERVMRKFVPERPGWRTVLFLLLDHFGGFNTLLSAFAYGGVAVCLTERTPESVCRTIEQSRATLLPTTPTFLNLLMASRSYEDFDLSSILLITYGTEVMPGSTLQNLRRAFPNTKLKQAYGLSELGVLRSKSEGDDSPWMKIGGEGFEVKIVDGILWVRSEANMVGYLNAPGVIDEAGWMCTGDQVEVRGEYLRVLGRKSEMINVGGQKVFPLEVETVLLEADNVAEATVIGRPHPLMGQVLMARVTLSEPEGTLELSERLRRHCAERLPKYKIPLRFRAVAEEEQRSARFKKDRKPAGAGEE